MIILCIPVSNVNLFKVTGIGKKKKIDTLEIWNILYSKLTTEKYWGNPVIFSYFKKVRDGTRISIDRYTDIFRNSADRCLHFFLK